MNYLAPVLLTRELMPLLDKGTSPRVINLSSAAQAPIVYGGFTDTMSLTERDAYAQSKLALTMWSFELARTHQDLNVIAVNPGSLLNTNMVKEAFGHHWSPAGKGADILHDLANAASHEGKSGMYFDNDKGDYSQAHQHAYDPSKLEELKVQTDRMIERY